MFEKTVFKDEAIPLILVINASEMIVKSNAYSTRSWPFSLTPNNWSLTYSFKSALFIPVVPSIFLPANAGTRPARISIDTYVSKINKQSRIPNRKLNFLRIHGYSLPTVGGVTKVLQNRAAHVLHGLSDPTAVELAKLLRNSLASELLFLLSAAPTDCNSVD